MLLLVLEAYWLLVLFGRYLRRGDFAALHEKVRNFPIRQKTPVASVGEICSAVDLACIWYPKQVFCLQRSAVTACLLKRHGVAAQLVIGAQQLPFRAHAWVEVAGSVVNDKSYTPEKYAVLDRC